MTYGFIAVEALVILLLMWALLVGQPAAAQAKDERIAAQSTENALLRAAVYATPTPTSVRRQTGPLP